jgi:hypothetical protein
VDGALLHERCGSLLAQGDAETGVLERLEMFDCEFPGWWVVVAVRIASMLVPQFRGLCWRKGRVSGICLSTKYNIECGEIGVVRVFSSESTVELHVIPQYHSRSEEIFVLDVGGAASQLLEIGDASLVILDASIVGEIWEPETLVVYDTPDFVVEGQSQMSSCGSENGIQQWWTTSRSLWHHKGKVPLGIANIKLGQSVLEDW